MLQIPIHHSIDPDDLAVRLVTECAIFTATREPYGLFEFLGSVYAVYWSIKRSAKVASFKQELISAAELEIERPIGLGSLLLTVAFEGDTPLTMRKWTAILDDAFRADMTPMQFDQEIPKLLGERDQRRRDKLWHEPSEDDVDRYKVYARLSRPRPRASKPARSKYGDCV